MIPRDKNTGTDCGQLVEPQHYPTSYKHPVPVGNGSSTNTSLSTDIQKPLQALISTDLHYLEDLCAHECISYTVIPAHVV